MMQLDILESRQLDRPRFDVREKMETLNRRFTTKLKPENGAYGVQEVVKDNGVVQRIGKNELGHSYKEYYRDGKLFKKRENLGNHVNETIEYDDNEIPYFKTVKKSESHQAKEVSRELYPNAVIKKGNFTSMTDAQGRLASARMTDVQIKTEPRASMPTLDKTAYRPGDQKGHLIPDKFYGPAGPENILPQNAKINDGAVKQVENTVRRLKEQGHKVDYEMRVNYKSAKDTRPSSFEPKIYVDGVEYTDLPAEAKKIYNDADLSKLKKFTTTVGEKFSSAHEIGKKNGLAAAGITMAASTVENVSAFVDGEIDAEEMVTDIAQDAAVAGAMSYGTAFVTQAASQAMRESSKTLIQRVGGSCVPAAVVSFAVDSYDSVAAFARGEIDGAELTYDLGESAASVAGSFAGGAIAGSAIGSAAGPVGTVAGGIIGGVVGCAIATEAYASVVELGAKGAEFVGEKAEKLAQETSDFFGDMLPDKMEEVKSAFNDFFRENGLEISV